jgi:hypothetical protein
MIAASSNGNWRDAARCLSRCDLRDELCMGRCADVNSYVEAILKKVYQASASLGPRHIRDVVCIHGPLALRMHRTELETTKL